MMSSQIPKLRRPVHEVDGDCLHLMGVADQGEDDFAFRGEVFGSARIGDAVDELLGTAHRAPHSGCGR